MGSYPAPFMASLFPCYFENKLILNLKKLKQHKAHSFANTFRFIDFMCAINGSGSFEKNSKKSTLKKKSELKKENVSRILREYKISTKLLDKSRPN